jgi:serine/threonine protein phosphatase PrpC
VSSTADSDAAAAVASSAGVDAMLNALARDRDSRAAMIAGLAEGAKAAAAVGSGTSASPPSCTYAAAAVVTTEDGAVEVTVGGVGDSRVYWLPDPPSDPECLTVDDSVAQRLITAGASAESEAVLAGAHTLTRWLGADAEPVPWSDSNVRTFTTAERGVLLVCTDGLWNYLSDAGDIAEVYADGGAAELVDYALRGGGQDNVTVAVIPIGGSS